MIARPPLVLASASPRRSHLLAQHGYRFEVIPAEVAEIMDPELSPRELVLFNARLKARAVAALHPDRIVLGADTVVAFQGRVFGKPTDMTEAVRMLSELNAQEHEVYSGVCLAFQAGGRESAFVETTRVRFKDLSVDARYRYLLRIGPLDKAGAYAAQDDAGEIIANVTGSFSNVVGLPMEALERTLREDFNPAVLPPP